VPSPQATAIERGESSGRSRRISPLETIAWTTAERKKPRMSAQRISQNMPKAKLSASTSSPTMSAARSMATS
jgi:hypothetical protein